MPALALVMAGLDPAIPWSKRAPRPGCPGTGGDFGPDLPLVSPPARCRTGEPKPRCTGAQVVMPGGRRWSGSPSAGSRNPPAGAASSSTLLTPRESAPRRKGQNRYTAYIPSLSSGFGSDEGPLPTHCGRPVLSCHCLLRRSNWTFSRPNGFGRNAPPFKNSAVSADRLGRLLSGRSLPERHARAGVASQPSSACSVSNRRDRPDQYHHTTRRRCTPTLLTQFCLDGGIQVDQPISR
jgi:hypothetical protein